MELTSGERKSKHKATDTDMYKRSLASTWKDGEHQKIHFVWRG